MSINSVKGRKSIRDNSKEDLAEISDRMKLNLPKQHHNQLEHSTNQRSNSEPPTIKRRSTFFSGSDLPSTSQSVRGSKRANLNTINEDKDDDVVDFTNDDLEEENLSKSNSQLNESDLDIDGGSSCTPTPIHLGNSHNTRRINSETNLNESQRRLSGFMGNKNKRFCASTSELSFTLHLDTEKSLFSPKCNQNALSRQSFNSSLYGSNLSLSSTNSKLFYLNSPFYNGKTMFGGASAYSKRDSSLNVMRTPVQMRPSSSLSNSSTQSAASDTGALSNTAKRLLEVMNKFSSPSKEARKMGNNINSILKIPALTQNQKRFSDEDLANRSIPLSQPANPYGRPLVPNAKNQSPINPLISKPLQIPTMSQLLQLKRLQSSTEMVRQIANKSENALNKTLDYKLPPTASTNVTSTANNSSSANYKIKSNITRNLLRSDNKQTTQEMEILEPLNLPEIKFPEMKSVPIIDIQLPVVSNASNNISIFSSSSSTTKPITATTFSSPALIPNNGTTKINSVNCEKTTKLCGNQDTFNFSSPIKLKTNSDVLTKLNNSSVKGFEFQTPLAIRKENDAGKNSKNKSSAEAKVPAVNGDILFKNLVEKQKAKWECSSCMTRNDDDKLKCICCEEPKPGTKAPAAASTSSSSGFFSQTNVGSFSFGVPISNSSTIKPSTDEGFKKLVATQTSKWECSSCLTRNDSDKLKCACCETPKPGSEVKKTDSSVKSSNDEVFKKLVATQSEKWECDSCLTRNDADKMKCLCCESAKPGSSTSIAAAPTPKFSFGMPVNSVASEPAPKFSFGMPASNVTKSTTVDAGFKKIVENQSSKWECSACMTRNDSNKSKCVCCEQPKPGSTPENVPQFSFGTKPVTSDVTPKFSFGMPAATASTIPSIVTENKQKDEVDKPKPVMPQFSFGVPKSSTDNVVVNTSKSETETKPAVSENPVASFTFKSPSTVASSTFATASFSFKPATSSPKVEDVKKPETEKPKEVEKTPSFTFGTLASKVEPKKEETAPKISFGTPSVLEEPKTTEIKFGESKVETLIRKEEPTKLAAGFSFGSNNIATSTMSPASANKPAGGFSFGSNSNSLGTSATNSTNDIVKSASTGGFSFGSSSASATPVFGSSTTTPTLGTNMFGSSAKKPEENKTFGSFGASSEQKPTIPIFGSSASTAAATPTTTPAATSNNTFSFSSSVASNSEQTKPQPPAASTAVFGFGSNASNPNDQSKPPSQPFLFGGAQSSQAATPVFGASTFGSFAGNTTSTQNNNSNNNNNNESGFGSKMPTFGSTFGGSATPSFSFGNQNSIPSNDEPSTKKHAPSFDFGATPNQSQSNAQFSFGQAAGNNVNNKNEPAATFSFTATKPSFNFTGQTQQGNTTGTSPTSLFQFGANYNTSSSPTTSVYTFGTNPAPTPSAGTFQFNATNPIGGVMTNPFAAQSTGNTAGAAQRRKIKATRRLTPR